MNVDARRRSPAVLWMLVGLGLLGTASMGLAPVERLLPRGLDIPRAALLVQPALIAAVAALVGWWAAPKVGLATPVLTAFASREQALGRLRAVMPATLAIAILGGACIGGFGLVAGDFLGGRAQAIELPLVTRVLYGGTVEELIFRWGLMAPLALGLSRFVSLRVALSAAAVLVALLFGAGHLPGLLFAAPDAPLWLPLAAMLANTVAGLAFGWLAIRKGLEAAMIGHGLAHVASLPWLAMAA